MKANNLSKRLGKVAEFINQYGQQPIRLVDIGSDHAYLPCNLVLNNSINYAIAGEVVDGPYQSAREEVENLDLKDKIDVRKGDGFEVVNKEDNINTASICGMGGILIRDILAKGYQKLNSNNILVLQANVAEAQLRKWLNDHHYQILDEDIIFEHNHYYEIIVAKQQLDGEISKLTDEEILFGPINLQHKTIEFYDKWLVEFNKLNEIIESMKNSDSARKEEMIRKLELIRKVISL